MRKILTLLIIEKDSKVLLGMKKKGFGAGRYNGFGGKVEEGESIEDAAKREILEEAGVIVKDILKAGIIDFEFIKNPGNILEVHIFKVEDFEGESKESEEMKPQWFNVGEIPFDKMWSDDIYWFPLFLRGKKFKARFLFNENDQVLEKELTEIDNF